MGQKVNPIGLRPRHQPHLGFALVRDQRRICRLLHEDLKMREHILTSRKQPGSPRW